MSFLQQTYFFCKGKIRTNLCGKREAKVWIKITIYIKKKLTKKPNNQFEIYLKSGLPWLVFIKALKLVFFVY